MICFPNAKINIGLKISSKRNNGFHDLESLFFPIRLFDILEVLKSNRDSKKIQIYYSGNISVISNDLCIKAYNLLDADFNLPSIKVHLHKNIPIGGGLGGGSSNAVSMLKMLNELFGLNLGIKELLFYCKKLGSDCTFFFYNTSSFVTGIGEVVKPIINFSLKGYKLLLITPPTALSTVDVFNSYDKLNLNSKKNKEISPFNLSSIKNDSIIPIRNWKKKIKNDLEESSFKMFPEIKKIKENLYEMGAIYASMTGSGSSVYGIFPKNNNMDFNINRKYFTFLSDLD